MKLYNKNVQILEDSIHKIDFILLESEMIFHIDLVSITDIKPVVIGHHDLEDQVLLHKEMNEYDNAVFIKSEEITVI